MVEVLMFPNNKFSQIILVISCVIGFQFFAPKTSASAQEPASRLQGSDLIEQLHLTPEQREKIRSMREQTKTERMALNQRLRESNMALEQALDSENLDESLLDQRIREVNAAQASQLRMRIQNEVQLRRILTPDQLATWRQLRQQARDVLRQLPNQRRRPQALGLPRTLAPRRQ